MSEQSQAGQENGWQPITTAPRDGSHILVVCSDAPIPEPDIAHWSDEDRMFRAGYAQDWAHQERNGKRSWYDCASHWMPLPTPPKATP